MSFELNFANMMNKVDATLQSQISATQGKESLTHQELIGLQKSFADWSMSVNMTSTVIKTMKDTLSSIIQRMG